ncbi:MAG: gliding motility-associated C-terminal domain-containing protein [Bacteroidetes bacterium]|nr:gliding motility-associated C-terminal domain-containing protein [Bacteroidota bacterium]
MKKLICLSIFTESLIFSTALFAQKENNIWYFGDEAGLDFNNNPPTALTNSSMFTQEGCASIADKNGNLLFYTDGSTVWNRNHVPMPNGTGLLGDYTATQSAIIVPKPLSSRYLYVFTVPRFDTGAIRYSLVDMTLDSCLGDVVAGQKNIFLVDSVTEKQTSVHHANGEHVWVITHLSSSDAFCAFLVTDTGVVKTPIFSNIGTYHVSASFAGHLKVSPNGKKLANGTNWNVRELFDFDNSTGIVSNFINLDSTAATYGVAFSPDNSKLYMTRWSSGFDQYDLLAGSPAAIIASKTSIFTSGTALYSLQLAANGKIYASRYLQTSLGVINDPNLLGAACNYVDLSQSLGAKQCRVGLPSFVQSYLDTTLLLKKARISNNTPCFGDTTEFFFITSDSPDSLIWNFGDTAAGPLNTSNLPDPVHLYTSIGTYNVTVIIYNGCLTDTFIKSIIIDTTITVDLGNDTTMCGGNLFYIDAGNPGASYLWSTGDTTQSVGVTVTGTYSVTVTVGSCIDSDTIIVTFTPAPIVNLGNDTTLCLGDSIMLDAGNPGSSFIWSTGDTTQTIIVGSSNSYTVEVTNNNCTDRDTVTVTVLPQLVVDLGNDTTLCIGFSAVLNAGNASAIFLWSTGDTTQTIIVSSSGVYTVKVTIGSCSASDTIQVTFVPPPVIDLGNDSTICFGADVLLDSGIPSANYIWSTSESTQTIIVSTTGVYWVSVSDGICTVSDTITITVVQNALVDLGNDTSFCEGNSITLDAGNTGDTYAWSTGDTTQTITLTKTVTGTYSVTVSNGNCIDVDTIIVSMGPLPDVDLGPDRSICDDILILDAGNSGSSYLWSTGDTTESITIITSDTYFLQVTDLNGCTGVDTIKVELTCFCDSSIFIPNAFTPNGDNLNDVLYVMGPDVELIRFMIYNRWGEKVFETNNVNQGWDGTSSAIGASGRKMKPGVFVYYVELECASGEVFIKTGDVTLIR